LIVLIYCIVVVDWWRWIDLGLPLGDPGGLVIDVRAKRGMVRGRD